MSAIILEEPKFEITLKRLCHELIEQHDDFSKSVLIGLQPRGIYLSRTIKKRLESGKNKKKISYGELDVTFYRDDFRRREEPLIPSATDMNFTIENKNIVLIDDVLFTGRTIRAALDALLDFGRPAKVELLILIDRRFSRHLPIEPDYVGLNVDSRVSEKVKVEWEETEGSNKVWLIPQIIKND